MTYEQHIAQCHNLTLVSSTTQSTKVQMIKEGSKTFTHIISITSAFKNCESVKHKLMSFLKLPTIHTVLSLSYLVMG